MNKPKLIVTISGPMAVGKSTLAAALYRRLDDSQQLRTYTTRPQRPDETPLAYQFLPAHALDDPKERKRLCLETTQHGGYTYGIPRPWDGWPDAAVVYVVCTRSGVTVLRRWLATPRHAARGVQLLSVLMTPPLPMEWARRLQGRKLSQTDLERLLLEWQGIVAGRLGEDLGRVDKVCWWDQPIVEAVEDLVKKIQEMVK